MSAFSYISFSYVDFSSMPISELCESMSSECSVSSISSFERYFEELFREYHCSPPSDPPYEADHSSEYLDDPKFDIISSLSTIVETKPESAWTANSLDFLNQHGSDEIFAPQGDAANDTPTFSDMSIHGPQGGLLEESRPSNWFVNPSDGYEAGLATLCHDLFINSIIDILANSSAESGDQCNFDHRESEDLYTELFGQTGAEV